MILIPSIDLYNRKAVQLVGGKLQTGMVLRFSPLKLAQKFRTQGAEWLHLIDLNAAFGRGDNSKLIVEIINKNKAKLKVQVGGGVRKLEKIERLFAAGASRVIVGTKAITDFAWLKDVVKKFPERIIVALDTKGARILVKGWKERSDKNLFEYAKKVDELGLAGVLYTNVELEGKLSGVDIKPIKKLMAVLRRKLIVSGGISSILDLKKIKALGVYAAVVGMALYTGKIDFSAVVKELSKEQKL